MQVGSESLADGAKVKQRAEPSSSPHFKQASTKTRVYVCVCKAGRRDVLLLRTCQYQLADRYRRRIQHLTDISRAQSTSLDLHLHAISC